MLRPTCEIPDPTTLRPTGDAAGPAARWLRAAAPAPGRVRRDGKFFRDAATGAKWFAKGYAYGPLPPDATRRGVERDLADVADGGANLVRLHGDCPPWLLDAAAANGLRVMIDVTWPSNLLTAGDAAATQTARRAVVGAARSAAAHPAAFAVCVANEIPSELVRYAGARATGRLLDALIAAGRDAAPGLLFTFANYPRTEYLRAADADFACFNVYLHGPAAMRRYLQHLHVLAGDLPLVLGEYGLDTRRETTEAGQAAGLARTLTTAYAAGVAGAVVFRHGDAWHAAGHDVLDWDLGVVRRDGTAKPARAAVARAFADAPTSARSARAAPSDKPPRVSVVVCVYNGAATLRACLASLGRLDYPDYETIVVDDGSTDATAAIAGEFAGVTLLRQPNGGLSHARNVGLRAATGTVVAYTDCDCEADEDWLFRLVVALEQTGLAGVGGPNLAPADEGVVAACVGRGPGGPAHVLLDDLRAEHVPGCNMAFRRDALRAVGGFDAQFRAAGDDVDLVWRLQDSGRGVAFAPAAQVWHRRRGTVGAYLAQQRGYGRAEALLQFKHPARFNRVGGALWRGAMWSGRTSGGGAGGRGAIQHGPMGTGLFQTLYQRPGGSAAGVVTSLEWHLLAALAFVCGLAWWPLLVVTAGMELAAVAVAARAAWRGPGLAKWWGRPLVAYLHLRQPIARGAARYRERWRGKGAGAAALGFRMPRALPRDPADRRAVRYWRGRAGPPTPDAARLVLLEKVAALARAGGLRARADSGWQAWDLELFGSRLAKAHLLSGGERHDAGDLVRVRVTARLTGVCGFLLVATSAVAAAATARGWPAPLLSAAAWAVPLALLLAAALARWRTTRRALALVDGAARELDYAPVAAPRPGRGHAGTA